MIQLSGKRVVVVGMAKSGQAAIQLLQEKGAIVRAVDEKPHEPVCGIAVQPQTPESFHKADLVVISPGVPADLPVLASANAPVIGELELSVPFLRGPILGITGSNGKTTTTAMIGHILKQAGVRCQVGGNIGTPPTAMIDTSADDQWNVLELSSFQLETIRSFRANIGVCLNVTPDHLDRHHTFEAYAAAKARLFETQLPEDSAVLNADDPTCVNYASHTKATVHWFSSHRRMSSGFWLDGDVIRFGDEVLMPCSDILLRGRHNIENAMAAATAAKIVGLTLEQIAAGIHTFAGVEHRLEFVRELNGVSFYNDSKATNVDATLKAVSAFPGGLWIILGGKDKDSDYTVLRDQLAHKARAALLIGSALPKIAQQLNGAIPILHSGDLETAIHQAWMRAHAGDTILLAPACASFDQFENYEHRGRVFKNIVSELKART